ncbi:probable methyltransferase PMT2 [Hordeum vulgare subsp. vulgare]|uniref:Methyltransferase n=1 Tax=Hordeum vulgare subsp. vulgare TaxID=112509 RepID=A0A8I6WTP9_HORVV|nr:probable methyltransferase PMT2 [Hordeum vulgare subsp. vulgare]
MRGSRMNPDRRTRSIMSVVIVMGLCGFFYILGAWQKSGTGRGDSIALRVTKETDCTILPNLHFETHHSMDGVNPLTMNNKVFKPCNIRYSDYTPCQDQNRAMLFPRGNMTYRERHCPAKNEKLHCLIPAPKGYVTPFPWPKSREYVPYANAPYKSLAVEKAVQNWIQYRGDVFHFPGGGTMFPNGASSYIDELASVIPLADGTIRTALDTGCGVASWGAYLMDRNILAMSFAPRDSHEAQVQFALERGVPAVIGVLGTVKLPYPSRSFDMAHCSRCLIPWKSNDGMYMMEVDRVLRPGGYWILSGPPINWKKYYKTWQRSKQDAEEEQNRIENIAEMLCWNKIYEKEDTVIWQKKENSNPCHNKNSRTSKMCKVQDGDDIWYKKMETCITPIPEGAHQLQKFPERLFVVPPRILDSTQGVTEEVYEEDKKLWKKHVDTYKRINKLIGKSRYRNIMDMNAGLGSFAAALNSPGSWVMNVVPTISERNNTLGIIYERGLIGIYHDWCEAFSTYPRTYDLIHASGVFSLYENKCDLEDILLEMDRILRPEGTVILRDNVEVLNKVRRTVAGMRWKSKLLDHEDGPLVPEKLLIAVKEYWVGSKEGKSS